MNNIEALNVNDIPLLKADARRMRRVKVKYVQGSDPMQNVGVQTELPF